MGNLLGGKRSTLFHFPDDEEGMVRDYCYVGDVVKVNQSVLENGSGEVFNIGTGHGTKTLALYNIISEAFKEVMGGIGEELEKPVRQMARPGDLSKSCLVVEKAYRSLAWVPETSLKEGIRKTLKWHLNQTS